MWKEKCQKEHACGTEFGKLRWRKKRSGLRTSQSQPVWGDGGGPPRRCPREERKGGVMGSCPGQRLPLEF